MTDANALLQSKQSSLGSTLAVKARGITKVFGNGIQALASTDLNVREGEFLSIIGPSGCGKSSLLRIVAGLLKPSSGVISLWPSSDDERRRVAFVFQSPTLMAWASVERNVRLPLELQRERAGDMAEKIDRALTLVGLEGFRRAYPRELSGGMQMRVSIARALVTQPRLLLMDEPFGALDEISRARLDRDLRELWIENALSVLFVTHSLYEAVYLSTRVLVMSARPGYVIGELMIDEPHPRTEEFRVSEVFARYCARLSALLAGSADGPGKPPGSRE